MRAAIANAPLGVALVGPSDTTERGESRVAAPVLRP